MSPNHTHRQPSNHVSGFCLFATWLSLLTAPAAPAQERKEAPVPEGVDVIRDIEFASVNGQSLKLDLYRPFDWADYDFTPVVIWIHGGGWVKGSKDNCPAAYLARENISVASIEYRLADTAPWPAQINDCYEAVRWVRKNAATYGFGDKIGVWGASAGGHLAALLGTRPFDGTEEISSQVQAVCDFYGPTDLLTMPPNIVSEDRSREQAEKSNGARLLGKTVRDVPDLAKDASAFHQASKGDAPILIVHGALDPDVPLEQSKKLHDKLTKAGVESTLIILPGAKHGCPEFRTEKVQAMVYEFFKSFLF